MKKMYIISLFLTACLLAGCAQAATDEEAFSGNTAKESIGEFYLYAATDEEAFAGRSLDKETAYTAEKVSVQRDSNASIVGLQATGTPEDGVQMPTGEQTTGSQLSATEMQPEIVSGAGLQFASAQAQESDVLVEDGLVPLAGAPAGGMLLPTASGTAVKAERGAEIDYSNLSDGYVMVRFAAENAKRLKVQVTGPTTTYTYDLPTGSWVTFPLSDGNGSYKTTVLENTEGKKYAVLTSISFQVALKDEFAPFLRPNQYVNYSGATQTIQKAKELTAGIQAPLDKVSAVYDYVINNLTYDKQKAASVSSGYLPVLDSVLAKKTGICFDYAALMTGMLRSQGIPCKLVVGYAGSAYHAWVSVWTRETGWVDNVIFFDGTSWQRMDPTFASSGKSSEAIMKYIGNGSNYSVKFIY